MIHGRGEAPPADGRGFLIDSNVLIDIISADHDWSAWSESALAKAARLGPVHINPIIYAEVSRAYLDISTLDAALPSADLRRAPLPYAAAFLAGKAHAAYRRRGGTRMATLPDFFIGAHALVDRLTLVTRDPRRYRHAFPDLRLVAPE